MIDLQGTEKQIRFAESIRKEVIQNVRKFQKELEKRLTDDTIKHTVFFVDRLNVQLEMEDIDYKKVSPEKIVGALKPFKDYLENQKSSKWWIEKTGSRKACYLFVQWLAPKVKRD